MKKKILFTSLAVSVFSLSLAGAEKLHLVSQLRDAAIVADGSFDDWYGNLQPLGEHPVSAQVLNDKDFLYLRLTASDPATRMEIMRLGFTVWFDPSGGTKRKFGIRYPVVEQGSGPPGEGGERGGERGGYGGGRRGPRRGGENGVDPAPANRVDILGPGKDDARSLTHQSLAGVEVGIHIDQGLLQYELKVPLAVTSDHPYAIGSQAGKTIGIGLETGKLQQPSMQGRGGGGGFGGGGGGRGGGMGGRGGGGGGRGGGGQGREGHEGQAPKPLKVWATVAIAPAR